MIKLIVTLVGLMCYQVSAAITSIQSSPTEACISGQKLCFGLPAECPMSPSFDCTMLALISVKANLKDGLDVDIYGKGQPNTWYGLGFVTDKGMSGATVVHCDYRSNSTVTVGEGYTSGYTFVTLPEHTLTQKSSANLQNGIIHCQWVQRPNGVAGTSGITFNIDDPYYVQLAYGALTDGQIKSHHTSRSISETPVNLTSVGIIVPNSVIPLKVRVHGSLMTAAWLGLVSISMMIARYHKESWGDKTIGNNKIWFSLHRGLMFSAIVCAISGMVSIFLHVKGWRAESPHQYLGLSANILMILQPIGALLRPAPDHPNRIYFNIVHFLGGNSGHLLAILALFFVFSLSQVTLSTVYFWLLVIFVGVYILTHLILQFHPHILATLNVIEEFQMIDLKNNPTGSSQVLATIEQSKKRILTLFITLVIVIVITIIIVINTGKPS